ncbi:hypothetical protein ACFUKV_33485 [Streptomyces paradoxus]|uniref:hypothetical protein n=1 Tax=Streptomyces paradoxus TaxID=66375 RepID=UPI0036363DC3
MGESLTQSRRGTTLPARGGQRGAEPRQSAGAPEAQGAIGTQRDGGPGPAEGHEAVMLLERARAEVDPVLRAALGSLPGPMRRVALHHFGWEQADGTSVDGGSGKAIRPALVLATAAALGGPEARAGAADWAQGQAADRMARAMQQLARAVPDPEAGGGLLALAEFVTRRSS